MSFDERLVLEWKSDRPGPLAVITLHGLVTHSRWFSGFAERLNALGVSAYGLERRGNGQARDIAGGDDLVVLRSDFERLLDRVSRDHERVIVAAWCFGARLAFPLMKNRRVHGAFVIAPALMLSSAVRPLRPPDIGEKGLMEVPFDLYAMTGDEEGRARIDGDELLLRSIPAGFLRLKDQVNSEFGEAFNGFPAPILSVLASRDGIINLKMTKEQLEAHPGNRTEWRAGAHDLIVSDAAWLAQRLFFFDAEILRGL